MSLPGDPPVDIGVHKNWPNLLLEPHHSGHREPHILPSSS